MPPRPKDVQRPQQWNGGLRDTDIVSEGLFEIFEVCYFFGSKFIPVWHGDEGCRVIVLFARILLA